MIYLDNGATSWPKPPCVQEEMVRFLAEDAANPGRSGHRMAVAAENALSTTIDGETVILHRDDGKYYGLNEVGTFIWERIKEPTTVGAVYQAMVDHYDVGPEKCRQDLEAFLADLAKNGLVVDVSA